MTECEYCIWCESDVDELVTHDGNSEGFIISGPNGGTLKLTYDDVCPDCWDDIRDQFERTGELTKPLAAFGGGVDD